MASVVELSARRFTAPGPDPMTEQERMAFFSFYKRHKSRRLFGFFRDLARSEVNVQLLSRHTARRASIRALLVGCSHWANPNDTMTFLRTFNSELQVAVAALDVLPDALEEAINRNVSFVPVITPAQETPFCNESFDVVVADGLLNCCCFEQHEPIIREIRRIARRDAILLLGLTHASRDLVVKWSARPIAAYCRPREIFVEMFKKYEFDVPIDSSIITPFVEGNEIATDNCIAVSRRGRH
jgi:SAM-dependent methyltransferase